MSAATQENIAKLVVDESISPVQLNACKKWLKKQGLVYRQIFSIAEHHPGTPDAHIIRTVLDKADVVLTADRPFHNLLLKQGWRSLFIDDSLQISQRPMRGVPAAMLPVPKGDQHQRAQMSGLHGLIMPESEATLKKLRSKRRRIRAHFGGYDQLQQISVTAVVRGDLVGLHLYTAGGSAKGIKASESYIREPGAAGDAALSHALILALQLMLHQLEVSIYYDPAAITDPALSHDGFFHALCREFPKLKFIATVKGRYMESLRHKLAALSVADTNEIVVSPLADIRRRFSGSAGQEREIPPPTESFVNPNTDRGALLLAAKWFVDKAKNLDCVKQIALIGSICTSKKNPKDIDLLLAIAAGADIAPLAKLTRQMQGRIQRGLLGADVFLVEEGNYLGRPCRYREPHMRVVCANDNLRCSLDRAFLCDTSTAFTLKKALLASPPIILYPRLHAEVPVPADVRAAFDLMEV